MYRRMRCGRGSKYIKMPGKCTGPKFLSKECEKNGEDVIWEVMTLGRRMDRQGEVLIWRRKCSGYTARQRMGPTADELLQTRTDGHQRVWQHVQDGFKSWRMVGSQQRRKEAGGLKDKREELQEKSIRGL